MTRALNLIRDGIVSALTPKAINRAEIVDASGEVIGTITRVDDRRGRYLLDACGRKWFRQTVQDCMARAEADYPGWKEMHDFQMAREAEVMSLPPRLRPLWKAVQDASTRVALEEARNVRRDDDLNRTRKWLADAEAAFAAAERTLAEAA